MSLRIRPETDLDHEATRAVHVAAFPTAAEAALVTMLHEDRDAVISLVAEEDGVRRRIIGHVMLSRMEAHGESRTFRALGLGPVAVLPHCQRRGIGCTLIRAALQRAAKLGEELVFVVGEPDYYGRFGFAVETAAPFASPYAGPYFMALKLRDVESPTSGRADYAPAFARLG